MGMSKRGPQAIAFHPGLADVLKVPPPTAVAPIPGQTAQLPPLPQPAPLLFPPVEPPLAPPSQHPALPVACPTGAFYADPPTRKQATQGTVLTPAEAAKKKSFIVAAIQIVKPRMPIAADNLQHWLDGTSSTKVLAAAPFQHPDSEVPTFLHNKARNKFDEGVTARLKSPTHPQGTLRPGTLVAGNKGPVRFLQFRDGLKASAMASNMSKDLFAALGGFNVHCVMWAQATFIGHQGGVPIFGGGDDVFEVEILKWCVQIYDVYDWNNSNLLVPLIAPFTITDAELAQLKLTVTLPLDGVSITHVATDLNLVKIADRLLSELEVSGVGRAYLLRSEVFEAPLGARGKFTVKI